MDNSEKYDRIFMEVLSLQPEQLDGNLVYNSVPTWDSIGHMAMMAMLENEFDIMLETEDIIDFSSYHKGKEILGKYDVKL